MLLLAGLAARLAVVFIAAGICAAASLDAGPFYIQLDRPVWAPPPSIFGPVWTVLYAVMAIAAWLVWRRWLSRSPAPFLFPAQLALNALWSWLFFGWHLGGLAFADILALWVLIGATIIAFWRIRSLPGAFARSLLVVGPFRVCAEPFRVAPQSAGLALVRFLSDDVRGP